MNPKRVTYKKYAGFVIRGTEPYNLSDSSNHFERSFWLATKVETNGVFGTVQSYDGAGMSAGLEHQIAVMPRDMSQGGLFKLLQKFANDPNAGKSENFINLIKKFKERGWALENGRLVNERTGVPISGADIQDEFTPMDGTVPERGPFFEKAKEWIILFAKVFQDPTTRPIQVAEGINKICNLSRDERRIYQALCPNYFEGTKFLGISKDISPELDLALAVYHSHSVNAPAIARKVLLNIPIQEDVSFAKALLNGLKEAKWGNWERRWKVTRNFAMNSGIWDKDLFNGPNAIMLE